MKIKLIGLARGSIRLRVTLLGFALCATFVILGTSAIAQSTKIIFRLSSSTDGNTPESPLVEDAAGNLYGTTAEGASNACTDGCGAVFELSPTSAGGWKNTVLHQFTGGDDGDYAVAGLARDSLGNLYGTATLGGKYGHGDVFELSPVSGGRWKFSVVYAFMNASDGGNPAHGVIVDSQGDLFGVSNTTAFELSPVAGGGWKRSLLHIFGDVAPTGITFDGSGNLFATTGGGGLDNGYCFNGCGTVYELSPGATGWTHTLLYSFTGNADGGVPTAPVILDSLGNLYGVTRLGGNVDLCGSDGGCGVVFELSPSGGGWNESVLLAFNYTDGEQPNGPLISDASGNLFGTAIFDNQGNCGCGLVYELSPASGGTWTQDILHVFVGGSAGEYPAAGLISDGSGGFYGTTRGGGNSTGAGTVFHVTP